MSFRRISSLTYSFMRGALEPCRHAKQNCQQHEQRNHRQISGRNFSSINKSASVVVSRMTMPDDANPLGIVHGGVMLNMIEEAGIIASTRYVNANNTNVEGEATTALVRVERMAFKEPVFVGEVVDLEAELVYTSNHSLLIHVDVYAENILKATKRLTNKARLWYVAVDAQDSAKLFQVPQMLYDTPSQEEDGYRSHLKAKNDRICSILSLNIPNQNQSAERYTVPFSQSNMLQLVHPSSCIGKSTFCRGGFIMKWMDECAGLVAAKHCLSPLVTVSMDATNFHKMCTLGTCLGMTSRVTFTSKRTIEVQCLVDAQYPFQGKIDSERAVEAFFTFVCFDKNKKIIPVPPLKVRTKDEKTRFEAGKKRYEERNTKDV